MDLERKTLVRAVAKENLEHHRQIKIDAIRSLDKVVFVVSTGAIGLSVGAIGYFNGEMSYFQVALLSITWIFLFASIISGIVAHIADAHASRLQVDIINRFVASGYTDPSRDWNMDTSDNKQILVIGDVCAFARLLSTVLLVVGCLTLFLFGGSILLRKTAFIQTTQEPQKVQIEIIESSPNINIQPKG